VHVSPLLFLLYCWLLNFIILLLWSALVAFVNSKNGKKLVFAEKKIERWIKFVDGSFIIIEFTLRGYVLKQRMKKKRFLIEIWHFEWSFKHQSDNSGTRRGKIRNINFNEAEEWGHQQIKKYQKIYNLIFKNLGIELKSCSQGSQNCWERWKETSHAMLFHSIKLMTWSKNIAESNQLLLTLMYIFVLLFCFFRWLWLKKRVFLSLLLIEYNSQKYVSFRWRREKKKIKLVSCSWSKRNTLILFFFCTTKHVSIQLILIHIKIIKKILNTKCLKTQQLLLSSPRGPIENLSKIIHSSRLTTVSKQKKNIYTTDMVRDRESKVRQRQKFIYEI
jgi:hypothetical protein